MSKSESHSGLAEKSIATISESKKKDILASVEVDVHEIHDEESESSDDTASAVELEKWRERRMN
jgi:hypothetical protein